MSEFKITRLTALPSPLEANTVYLIGPSGSPDYIEMYVTGNTASVVRRIPTESDIDAMVAASITAADGGSIEVVTNIAARDALGATMTTNGFVYVMDASGDSTVDSGGATYIYAASLDTFTKTAEAESQDLIFSWNNIQNGPTSSVAAIDAAVAASHTHSNSSNLDLIGADVDGNLTYDGSLPATAWEATDW